MKILFRNGDRRSELSTLMMVVGLLMSGVLAKLGVAVQLFHLAH